MTTSMFFCLIALVLTAPHIGRRAAVLMLLVAIAAAFANLGRP